MIISQVTDTQALIRAYVTLTKPRIIVMLLFTALGGLFLASRGVPDLMTTLYVLVGGTLASGGANAINQSMDRDIDEAMQRTQARPVVLGIISSQHAMIFGIALNVVSFIVLAGLVNVLSAVLTLSATLFYVLVYTKALKRTSTQNIVIGGAAGAIPPMVGWTAVTGAIGLPAMYLFAIVFFWTPPHFWALAIMIKDDYKAAGIPMLPVVVGVKETRRAMFLYTLILTALTALLYVTTDQLSLVYLVGALILGATYIYFSARLWWKEGRGPVVALYKFSLLYLGLLFTLIMVDASWF